MQKQNPHNPLSRIRNLVSISVKFLFDLNSILCIFASLHGGYSSAG